MNDDSVTTYTLNSLCNIFDCELSDIMEFLPDKDHGNRSANGKQEKNDNS